MLHHFHKHTISFKHAFDGIAWALSTQPNYKFHLALALLSIVGSFVLKVAYSEFIIILLLITIGLVIETINTSIEKTTDAIDLKQREDIRIAKDVAAGAMLIFSIGAFVISCIIFIPKILTIYF